MRSGYDLELLANPCANTSERTASARDDTNGLPALRVDL
jgi:hypothetical protein